MPTPSSRDAPDSISFASSCPDDQAPRSPSSWHPPPPYHIAAEEAQSIDDETSRETTMSPSSETRSEATFQEPVSLAATQLGSEDSNISQTVDTDPESRRYARVDERMRVMRGALRLVRGATRLENHAPETPTVPQIYDDSVPDDEDLDWYVRGGPSMGYDYSNLRVIPTSPSSYLRPGSRFTGTQQSERQVYDVQVEIKHVDLKQSFLCGYLRIQGLTEDHPTLTTYFEGEIIGPKYGFMTKHETWGANDKIDISHWSKFAAFREFAKQIKRGSMPSRDLQKENFFMRWKEHFLVPDHKVRTINGASFEGFYYICFNQIEGSVSGIYFHAKSEKFQQLELKHVEDKGCYSAIEFR